MNTYVLIEPKYFMNHMCRPNKFVPAKNICIVKQTQCKMIKFTHRNTLLKNVPHKVSAHVALDTKEPFNTK